MRYLKAANVAFSLIISPVLASAFGVELAASASQAEAQLKDATGTPVASARELPKRVVTLAPSLAELTADILGESELSRVVGVSEYTDTPASLTSKPSIGPYHQVNLEKVVALKPDLVLATQDGNARDQILRLRELGLRVVVVATSNLEQITDSMKLVAAALGKPAEGEKMAARLQAGVKEFRERGAKRKPGPRVLVQIGEDPLVVVGRNSFLHEALDVVGARNAYADSTANYPRPSLEDAVSRNPDVVLVLALGRDLAPFHKMARGWKAFPKLQAVRDDKVRVLQGDTILRPTLRLLDGLKLLERAIHAER